MFPINMVTKRSPVVSTMMMKTTSNQSVVLSKFPKVLSIVQILKGYFGPKGNYKQRN